MTTSCITSRIRRPLMLLATVAFAMFTITASAGAAGTISGTIAETMNTAGYTYVRIDTGEKDLWVAIPETKLVEGEEITVFEGMVMKDFFSNSLDRTFASIVFSPGVAGDSTAAPPGMNPHRTASASPHGGGGTSSAAAAAGSFAAAVAAERNDPAGAAASVDPVQGSAGSMGAIAPFTEVSVEKADGDNGFTVGEIFARAEQLDGETVRVRAQIVKANANIMGRNWLHLQDGTGDPMHNTHDLVVTTTEQVSGPNIVTVEGTVSADKDFGAGYQYPVIIENSTIVELGD